MNIKTLISIDIDLSPTLDDGWCLPLVQQVCHANGP